MELTIQLEEHADLAFIKKLLTQIKGIKSVEFCEEEKTNSWQEIESSEAFAKLLRQSQQDIEEGRYQEYSEELMDSIFNRK